MWAGVMGIEGFREHLDLQEPTCWRDGITGTPLRQQVGSYKKACCCQTAIGAVIAGWCSYPSSEKSDGSICSSHSGW